MYSSSPAFIFSCHSKTLGKKTTEEKIMSEDNRPDWDSYYMDMAIRVATRATCPRKHVGAIITLDNVPVSSGYNGSLKKQKHCTEVGCLMENGHCIRTVHAEANALMFAARKGRATEGASIYVTASPCWNCFKLIAQSGIKKIAFGELYRDERITKLAEDAGIELVNMSVKPKLYFLEEGSTTYVTNQQDREEQEASKKK